MQSAIHPPRPPHAALLWLIRGTGAFIASASLILGCVVLASIAFAETQAHLLDFVIILALLLLVVGFYGIRRTRVVLAVIFVISACYFFGCLLVATLQGQPQSSATFGWLGAPLFVLGTLALLWMLGAIFLLISKRGYDMWLRVDKITVSDFASVFALFAARVFHYFLPTHLPEAIKDHVWLIFRDPGDKGSRMLWTWLALYVFYKLIKAPLMQILDLKDPPQNPQTPSRPDDPFIPFDPYNLSQNRPIRPL